MRISDWSSDVCSADLRGLRTEDLSSRMDAVERLEAPTLVIWGDNDVFQPKALGERLARTVANGQFEVLEQAGHFLPEDAPEALAELITKFGSEERRVGKGCVSKCRSRVSPYH